MSEFLKKMLTDEKGSISSKRTVGVICALSLVLALLVNVAIHYKSSPSDALIYAVLTLAVSALSLTAVDKYTNNKK
jgi:multisubunit Na+/H+ antiporter MnhB subunit